MSTDGSSGKRKRSQILCSEILV